MARLSFHQQTSKVVASPAATRAVANISRAHSAHPFLQGVSVQAPTSRAPRPLVVASATAPSAAPATVAPSVPWWERPAPENVKHITTVQEMVDELAVHREQLVIAEFFAPWCGACRSLYPKICKIAGDNPDVVFLCINFDESRTLCKGLNVRVLPYFHFYRGTEGRVAAFSASVSKVQLIRDMIALHNTPRCSLGSSTTLEEFPDVQPGARATQEGNRAGGLSGRVEDLPSASGSANCDFCGPPHGIAAPAASAAAQAPPIVAGPFDGDALMA